MAITALRAADRRSSGLRGRMPWPVVLVALGVAAAALTVWGSWAGSRSDYYAAIALSMSRSWPDFFFGALDPAGTVTLDKIPGSFWLPALFVKVFGFSTFAVVLPNALAAVGAVLVLAATAKRLAGPVAGIVTGAIAATTPIFVAVARSNQPEMFFVLALALTAWASTKALQRTSLSWLLLSGVFIAAAFQRYMIEAWAVWPALAAAYLCTRLPLRQRVGHLLLAGTTSALLSVAWIVIVSLTPSDSRPYIGSTLHNSAWEMVFGYNGLGRFGPWTSDGAAYRSFTPPYSGSPGLLRVFAAPLAGQIGWLIPAALVAVVVLVLLRVPTRLTVFLGGWFATFLAMFSMVAGMHQFYTASLAVPMSLLIGIAFAHARRRGMLWPQLWLLAVAAATSLGIAVGYGGYSVPVALVQAVLASAAIAMLVLRRPGGRPARAGVLVLTIMALVLAPASWSIVGMTHPSSVNPVAGGVSDLARASGPLRPAAASLRQRALPAAPRTDGMAGTGATRGDGVLPYLERHAGSGKYLVAVFGAQRAAALIVASGGASVLPIGGFSGTDPVPTLEAFAAMVEAGDIPFVLISGTTPGGFFSSSSATATQIRDLVTSRCTEVPADVAGLSGLYRCAGG